MWHTPRFLVPLRGVFSTDQPGRDAARGVGLVAGAIDLCPAAGMAALEEEEYVDEEYVLDDDEEELDEDDDMGDHANAYFAAHNRRSSVGRRTSSQSSKYAKRSTGLADLPGGGRQELTEAVHALLERPTTGLSPALRSKFRPKYAEWLSTLHAGFGLLLHGFGSKKALLDDFASAIEKHDSPVVVLEGYSSGARVRDLLLTILNQVLKMPTPPSGSTRALCKQVRQAFAASTPPPAPPTSGAETLVTRLFTAGRCAEIDQGALSAAHCGLGPLPPAFQPKQRGHGKGSTAAAAAAAAVPTPAPASMAAPASASTSASSAAPRPSRAPLPVRSSVTGLETPAEALETPAEALGADGEDDVLLVEAGGDSPSNGAAADKSVADANAADHSVAVPSSAARISPGGARDVGFAAGDDEAQEATAEAEAAARSEAILSPQGATKRERRVQRMLADSEHYAGAGASVTGRILDGPPRSTARGAATGGAASGRKRDYASVAASSEHEPSPVPSVSSPFEPSPVVEVPGARRMLRARQPQPSDLILAADDGLVFTAGERVRGGPLIGGGAMGGSLRPFGGSGAPTKVPAHVYVVIHAIDSAGLRSEESQALLAELARIPQIHLVASCSHRNTAVIWDARKARALNWVWCEAGTGASYAYESADSIHELLGRLYESAHSAEGHSAQVVLGHLTHNAREIFKLIIKYQLDQPRAAGLSFAELYQRARENFYASSETGLRKHINEFVTHDLVRIRAGPGGQQVHYCPFPGETLQQLLANQENA